MEVNILSKVVVKNSNSSICKRLQKLQLDKVKNFLKNKKDMFLISQKIYPIIYTYMHF